MLDFTGKKFREALNSLGFNFYRKKEFSRASLRGCLDQAVKNGLNPNTVIDVGVAFGTQALYDVFEYAKFVLFEPVSALS